MGVGLCDDPYWGGGFAAGDFGDGAPYDWLVRFGHWSVAIQSAIARHHRLQSLGHIGRDWRDGYIVAILVDLYRAKDGAFGIGGHLYCGSPFDRGDPVPLSGEKLNAKRAFGIAIGFGGVCLLFAPALLDHGVGATSLGSQALLLVAAFLYSTTTIMVRLVNPNLHPVAMSFGFVTLAAVFSIPFSIASWPEGGVVLETRHMVAILGLGALCTGLANMLYVLTIRRVGAVFMTNVGNLAPFWSILVGAVAFSEALPATTFIALAIMLVGVWLVQRRGTGDATT
jgi:uncharacterized membrane protein